MCVFGGGGGGEKEKKRERRSSRDGFAFNTEFSETEIRERYTITQSGKFCTHVWKITLMRRRACSDHGRVSKPFLCFINCGGQSHKTGFTNHNFWSVRRAKAELNWGRPSAYQANWLTADKTRGGNLNTGPISGHMINLHSTMASLCELGR